MKRCCNKVFMLRQLQDNLRAKLCRDIFKVYHDIIQEEGTKLCHDSKLQATTKLENKDSSYIATKQPTRLDF